MDKFLLPTNSVVEEISTKNKFEKIKKITPGLPGMLHFQTNILTPFGPFSGLAEKAYCVLFG